VLWHAYHAAGVDIALTAAERGRNPAALSADQQAERLKKSPHVQAGTTAPLFVG
jgi:hypothetical protein